MEDHVSGEVTVFEYDMTGRMVGSQVYDSQTYKTQYGSHVEYDKDSRVRKISYQAQYKYGTLDTPAWAQQFYTFGYSEETGYLQTLTFADNAGLSGTVSLAYNSFGMTTQKSWSFKQNSSTVHYGRMQYEYQTVGYNQTALVSTLTVQSGKTASNSTSTKYRYTYDENGNITHIRNAVNDLVAQYTYDDLGQLTQEINVPLGRRYVWTYDTAGNILSRKTYNYSTGALTGTKNYTYGNSTWGDLLTKVGSDSIEYDKIGNPTIWGQKNEDGIWFYGALLEWQGRQLQSYQPFDEYDDGYGTMYYPVNFKYNDEGIRTYKEQDGIDHEYILNGSQIVGEWIHNRDILILYIYDETGAPIGMKMRTSSQAEGVFDEYFFEKNLQGDIVAIYNANGTKIGSYTYDAWGNFTVALTTGNTTAENNIVNTYNPFRYRGYYYDVETGLYYLQSRYYNPQWGRFINSDNIISGVGGELLGNNPFVYSFNNPVNMNDHGGTWPKWVTGTLNIISGVGQMAAGAVLGATVGWTGVGAVAAGFLVVNGAATIAQGVGQIVNDVADSEVMREDNIVRTGVQEVGHAIGGDTGAQVAGGAYDVAVVAANIYATTTIMTPSACFVAGTAILTNFGEKAIEEIVEGDFVWSKNTETGETTLKKVKQTFVRESDEIVCVYVNNEIITTTPEHPFYVPTKGWTSALNLRAGDILVLQNGKCTIVEKIQHEILETSIKVYNFEVEDFHTYFVGKNGVLVHNTCQKFSPDQQAVIELAKESRNGLSRSEAEILVSWAREYGIRNHGPMIHPNRSGVWSFTEHIKIFNEHIPIK